MSENTKPGFWTRVKWLLLGKPVSHEEAQAARGRGAGPDPMTYTQNTMRGTSGRGGMGIS